MPSLGPSHPLQTRSHLPARDTLFEQGFKAERLRYGPLNRDFVDNILQFCIDHRLELAEGRRWIIARGGRPYPLMKLVDMHFWQKATERRRERSQGVRGVSPPPANSAGARALGGSKGRSPSPAPAGDPRSVAPKGRLAPGQ